MNRNSFKNITSKAQTKAKSTRSEPILKNELQQNCKETKKARICPRLLDKTTTDANKMNSKRLEDVCSPLTKDNDSEDLYSNDSMAMFNHNELKKEREQLTQEVNELKLQIAALNIETSYLEEEAKKLKQRTEQKASFSDNIKTELLDAAKRVLSLQTAENLPHDFHPQIFAIFSEDEALMADFKLLDIELSKVLQEQRVQADVVQQAKMRNVINKKMQNIREELVKKYKSQLDMQEQQERIVLLAMKRNCFELLTKYLSNLSSEVDTKYLEELEKLYENETQQF